MLFLRPLARDLNAQHQSLPAISFQPSFLELIHGYGLVASLFFVIAKTRLSDHLIYFYFQQQFRGSWLVASPFLGLWNSGFRSDLFFSSRSRDISYSGIALWVAELGFPDLIVFQRLIFWLVALP